MPNVTVRVRITKAEWLADHWRISTEGTLPMETDSHSRANTQPFDEWVGKYATLVVNPEDQIISAQPSIDPPKCRCCNGAGIHEHRAYVGGRSPEDYDMECSVCAGRGVTFFDARPNSCTGFRTLTRRQG